MINGPGSGLAARFRCFGIGHDRRPALVDARRPFARAAFLGAAFSGLRVFLRLPVELSLELFFLFLLFRQVPLPLFERVFGFRHCTLPV
jgi:hypothetical protein